ncbi:DEAD/DEAH box helicase [Candidatus Woesearchaeota archaeon]|nr:DEAD/DEAH box helicase [Candidatus Woesearchaeota archaeon]
MKFKGFTLDPFQEEAVLAIEGNNSVVVSAPTGSGKTLIADYIIDKHKDDGKRIIYTAPIKALSNQKYRDFSKEYGADKIGLMTGDIVINPHAKVLIMTTEVYRNMVVSNDKEVNDVAYVIFDEVHYINDLERGYIWEESIIYSPEHIRFLALSATIPNAQEFSDWIHAIKHHEVVTVISDKRNVPLKHLFYDYELGITTLEKVKKAVEIPRYKERGRNYGKKSRNIFREPEPSHIKLIEELGTDKLPCLFFSFSRKDCQIKAKELMKRNLFKKDPKILTIFNKFLEKAPPEITRLTSTQLLKQTLQQGIAFHHAGILPVLKEAVEELFGEGLIKVLYATETFAVGINMPAKTVCFNSLRKYDGRSFRNLNTKEYFQIAGRAGRRGIDTIGYVVSLIFRPKFKYQEVKRITDADVEPIKSQFRLSINTVLNLVHLHTPEQIEKILRLSFFSYQEFGEDYGKVPTKFLLARYNSIVKQLNKYEYIVDGSLTTKGIFSSRVYADEISMGEAFATDFHKDLDLYQMLLVITCLVYEHRETTKFTQEFKDEKMRELKSKIREDPYLCHEKKFLNMNYITAFIYPIFQDQDFFDILKYSNLLEGDLIRIYSQVLDRLGQIRKASSDHELLTKVDNCEDVIKQALEGIYLI